MGVVAEDKSHLYKRSIFLSKHKKINYLTFLEICHSSVAKSFLLVSLHCVTMDSELTLYHIRYLLPFQRDTAASLVIANLSPSLHSFLQRALVGHEHTSI